MSNILFFVSLGVLLICIIVLICYSILLRKKYKCNCDCSNNINSVNYTLAKLDNLIETSVGAINQKMVAGLKSSDSFYQREKEEAFLECKSMVLNMLQPSLLNELSALVGDVDEWIDTRIEYEVRKQKYKTKF